MACYNAEQIQQYLDGELHPIAQGIVRDHLLGCAECRLQADRLAIIGKTLQAPPLREPPEAIIRNVLKRLYPELPRISSIAAMIAASFAFLLTWIFFYFDFANNSLVRALKMMSQSTADWIATSIKAVSALFTYIYASFKTIRAFLQILLQTNTSIELVISAILATSLLSIFLIYRLVFRKQHGNKA